MHNDKDAPHEPPSPHYIYVLATWSMPRQGDGLRYVCTLMRFPVGAQITMEPPNPTATLEDVSPLQTVPLNPAPSNPAPRGARPVDPESLLDRLRVAEAQARAEALRVSEAARQARDRDRLRDAAAAALVAFLGRWSPLVGPAPADTVEFEPTGPQRPYPPREGAGGTDDETTGR